MPANGVLLCRGNICLAERSKLLLLLLTAVAPRREEGKHAPVLEGQPHQHPARGMRQPHQLMRRLQAPAQAPSPQCGDWRRGGQADDQTHALPMAQQLLCTLPAVTGLPTRYLQGLQQRVQVQLLAAEAGPPHGSLLPAGAAPTHHPAAA